MDLRDWRDRPSQDIHIFGDATTNEDGTRCKTGIAVVVCPTTGSQTGTANARLIAASPDFYAELTRQRDDLLAWARSRIPMTEIDRDRLCRIEKLLASIEGGAG